MGQKRKGKRRVVSATEGGSQRGTDKGKVQGGNFVFKVFDKGQIAQSGKLLQGRALLLRNMQAGGVEMGAFAKGLAAFGDGCGKGEAARVAALAAIGLGGTLDNLEGGHGNRYLWFLWQALVRSFTSPASSNALRISPLRAQAKASRMVEKHASHASCQADSAKTV